MMAEKTFTKDELAKYNGQNGQPAYVAIKGVVYDVSGKAAWQGGKHHGNLAGQAAHQLFGPLCAHRFALLYHARTAGRIGPGKAYRPSRRKANT